MDQNGQPQFMHPPHGYIHAPQGMPLLPPPIMNQNGQIVSNYHRGKLNKKKENSGKSFFATVTFTGKLQSLTDKQ